MQSALSALQSLYFNERSGAVPVLWGACRGAHEAADGCMKFLQNPPHERGHDPRKAQAAAGGRFIHALQASVFWGVVGLCEGRGGLPDSA